MIVDDYFNFFKDAEDKEITIHGRSDAIEWDDYFMQIAELSAKRSKDNSTQVGCVIVDKDNRILSIGYNGFPRGIHDDKFPWNNEAPEGKPLIKKNWYVVHAEANAIMNSRDISSLKGAKVYVTLFPCAECCKLLIQAGVSEIIYKEERDNDTTIASRLMFEYVGIYLTKYKENNIISK